MKIVHAARDIARLRDISTVLIRHGFGEVVARIGLRRGKGARPRPELERGSDPDLRPSSDPTELAALATPEEVQRGDRAKQEISLPVRLRMVLEDLGPTFVKLGQIMSTRPDVVPSEVITELKKLQDAVPPVPFEDIRLQVERALGVPLGDVFESIDETPLAAGSIAQVHRAVLKSPQGPRQVVVKVQRPGIVATIASDVDLMRAFASLLERAIPESRIYSPVGLVQQFDRATSNELDFTLEAENAAQFRLNFEKNPRVRFPEVFHEASSKQVITQEFLDGKRVYDALGEGYSGKKLAKIALEVVVKMIFEDGFFHADPHPGNAIVLGVPEQPVLALIDLGMVGRLSPRLRDLTTDIMIAALRRDYDGIADALYAIGTPTAKIDRVLFRAEVALRSEKYLGRPLKDIKFSSLIRDLVQGATQFGLRIPTDFTLVGKAMMTLEGVGKDLDPELEVFAESRPLFLRLVKKRYSPERLGNELLRRLERLSGATDMMPQQIQEVLEDLRLGRLNVNTIDPGIRSAADLLGKRVFVGLVTSSLLLSSTLLLAVGIYWLGGILFLLCAIWLTVFAAMESYRAIFTRKR